MTVSVNPPKTPVTEGSQDLASATLPNVCKMPGPPAPFVPTPLPNIGKSGDNLKKCTNKVLFEGKKVAIEGSYYMSMGDMASKGTGGGIVSSATHGKTKFVGPGSMNVKAEGKNIQLLGDAMTNNGGSPANAGTLPGNVQASDALIAEVGSDVALALCTAACGAIDLKENPKTKDKYKTQKYQNLMRDLLDPKVGKLRGAATNLSKGICTEVAQEIGGALRFIGKWGTRIGKVPFVKWDIVLTAVKPAGSLLGKLGMGDVSKIVEVKFPKDSPTPNQAQAKQDLPPDKFYEMKVEDDCKCPKAA